MGKRLKQKRDSSISRESVTKDLNRAFGTSKSFSGGRRKSSFSTRKQAATGDISKPIISTRQTTAMIEVNCIALTALTEAVLPYLHPRCRILNFASAAAFLPQPEFAVYAATKAYVLSYSLALGKELKDRGVTVTAICPGPVTDTEFFGIAEEKQSIADYKKAFVVGQERVVRQAIEDAFAGKTVSVCSLPMKAFRAMTKVLPWDLILNYYN